MENLEIISVYTLKSAINDGILIPMGTYQGLPVIFTHNFLNTNQRGFIEIIESGLELLKVMDCQDSEDYKFRVIDKRTWLIFDSQAYTFMHPEDY